MKVTVERSGVYNEFLKAKIETNSNEFSIIRSLILQEIEQRNELLIKLQTPEYHEYYLLKHNYECYKPEIEQQFQLEISEFKEKIEKLKEMLQELSK